jgi:hypothetical protein
MPLKVPLCYFYNIEPLAVPSFDKVIVITLLHPAGSFLLSILIFEALISDGFIIGLETFLLYLN